MFYTINFNRHEFFANLTRTLRKSEKTDRQGRPKLTFRLPSYLCDIGYQGGGYHPLRFSVWLKILYRV